MDLELESKKVVVTGGAKGIGASIVRSFAKEGAVPILLGRNPERKNYERADLTQK